MLAIILRIGEIMLLFFLFLMFIGGCAGSTTGGLKIFRFQILFKYIVLHLKKMLQPHMVISAHFNGKKVPEATYESVMTFFFIYIITFAVSALLLSFSGIDFFNMYLSCGICNFKCRTGIRRNYWARR